MVGENYDNGCNRELKLLMNFPKIQRPFKDFKDQKKIQRLFEEFKEFKDHWPLC